MTDRNFKVLIILLFLVAIFLCPLLSAYFNRRFDPAYDEGFKAGLIAGRSEGHHFILKRISPKWAGEYVRWLEKNGHH